MLSTDFIPITNTGSGAIENDVQRENKSKPAVATAQLGHIAAFVRSGFPQAVLLPIAPIDAVGVASSLASPGKSPAMPAGEGKWKALYGWRRGADPLILRNADRQGANCGLLLGIVADGRQFVMIDVDTRVDTDADVKLATLMSRVAIDEVAKQIGRPIWVRYTRPGRCAILVGIAADQEAGRKREYHLSRAADGEPLGKVECLCNGQQTVVGGRHAYTRDLIWWERTDRPGQRYRAPTAAQIPVLTDRAALDAIMDGLMGVFRAGGIDVHMSRKGAAVAQGDKLEGQLPPSVDLLVRLLERMEHDAELDRGSYIGIMRATAGCMQALEALLGLSEEDADRIRIAAVEWAARWPGRDGKVTSFEAELFKWDEDFAQCDNKSGWNLLMEEARHLGLRDIVNESAAEEFADFIPETEPAPSGEGIAA